LDLEDVRSYGMLWQVNAMFSPDKPPHTPGSSARLENEMIAEKHRVISNGLAEKGRDPPVKKPTGRGPQ